MKVRFAAALAAILVLLMAAPTLAAETEIKRARQRQARPERHL